MSIDSFPFILFLRRKSGTSKSIKTEIHQKIVSYLAEQPPSTTSCRRVVVDVDVVVLARDWLLDKGLGDDLVPDLDRVLVNDLELGHRAVPQHRHPAEFELLVHPSIEVGSSISIHGESSGRGNVDLLQDLEDETAVPEDGLEVYLVHTEGCAQLDILDRLVEREALGEERDEKVASWPGLYIYGQVNI